MILSKPDLERRVVDGIVSRPDGCPPVVECSSIQLHLDNRFIRYLPLNTLPLNTMAVPPFCAPSETFTVEESGTIDFPPGGRLLGATLEMVDMPLDLMGFIQTKGSIARGFVMAHLCDGQIDPGYRGNVTLELANLSDYSYALRPRMPIAQLFLVRLTTPLDEGYSGRYQAASGPTPMRLPERQ